MIGDRELGGVNRLQMLRHRIESAPSSSTRGVPAPADAGLRLDRIAFWSQQVALHGYDLTSTDYDEIVRRRTARRIAIEQYIAARAA